jgi:peptide/nickel transport system permease protein
VARFVIKRTVGLLLALWVTSFLVFASLYLAPGSPVAYLTGGRQVSAATIAAITRQFGLDRPFFVQYWHWLAGVVHGNFGKSLLYQQSVAHLLGPRALNTALLIAYGGGIILIVGIGLGVLSAIRGGRTDSSVMIATTVGMAIPSFVMSVVLILVFGVELRWLPAFGSGTGLWNRLEHLTLPAIALALWGTAYVARLTRTAAAEELTRDHVETARVRGIPERLLIRRHVVRNSMIPVTTVAAITIAGLIAGSVIVETAFSLNGIGAYLVQAVDEKDFPVVQAITLILVAAFIVVNTGVDMLYAALDPRVTFWSGDAQ